MKENGKIEVVTYIVFRDVDRVSLSAIIDLTIIITLEEEFMSIHIGAEKGDIAERVLLPGDPLRAQYIAEKFLKTPVCYNKVRGALGFTGTFKGKPVSVQSTGMGMPSFSIYAEELISDFGCKTLMRVGSCGSIQENLSLRDIILAISASTDSNVNRLVFKEMDFAPTADFLLLKKAYDYAVAEGVPVKVGQVMTSDTFYNVDPDFFRIWKQHGILAFEMEAAALYTIAARHGVRGLALLTVSDCILTGKSVSARERERTFDEMCDIALNIL